MRGIAEQLALLLLVAGCASNPSEMGGGGRTGGGRTGGGRTGGVELDFFVRTADGRLARYVVDRAGRLHFYGGSDALSGDPSWTGDMTDAEIDELRGLLEQHGWFAERPEPLEEAEMPLYRVRIVGPRFRRRLEVRGETTSLEEVSAFLHGVSGRRLQPVLDALPKAGSKR